MLALIVSAAAGLQWCTSGSTDAVKTAPSAAFFCERSDGTMPILKLRHQHTGALSVSSDAHAPTSTQHAVGRLHGQSVVGHSRVAQRALHERHGHQADDLVDDRAHERALAALEQPRALRKEREERKVDCRRA